MAPRDLQRESCDLPPLIFSVPILPERPYKGRFVHIPSERRGTSGRLSSSYRCMRLQGENDGLSLFVFEVNDGNLNMDLETITNRDHKQITNGISLH